MKFSAHYTDISLSGMFERRNDHEISMFGIKVSFK